MSFLRAARAARAGHGFFHVILGVAVVVLTGFFLSCGSSSKPPAAPNHGAYVTLPINGSVLQLNINGATGAITTAAQTPQVQNASPTGLALLPSKKFLYVMNSGANSISIFSVAGDGSLTLSAAPTPVGFGPNNAVIDPSGQYLLVTNNFGSDVSVYSIDSGSGALTEVQGSPFLANSNPTEIVMTANGNFVYVTNPGLGAITAFSFSSSTGFLTQLTTSPYSSLVGGGGGAAGLIIDHSQHFLYVANPSVVNPSNGTQGNVSGFNIDPTTGALSPILGTPFFSATSNAGPTALAVDPSGRFLYATSSGASFGIWCFAITSSNGQLTPVTSSPFSLAAGGLFALIDPSGNYFYIGNNSANGINGYTYNSSTGAPTLITNSPFATFTGPGKMILSE